MTDRLEELFEKMAENQIELQDAMKEMAGAVEKLAEGQANLGIFVNGLHDKQTKSENPEG